MITVSEAHRRWGDLAKIIRGHTHWITIQVKDGDWKPTYDDTGILLLGYEFHPGFNPGIDLGCHRVTW